MTEHCNFCESYTTTSSSRYRCISEEESLDEKDNEQLRKEVEKLRILIKRMNGKDECASFTELTELISHLRSVQCIVLSQQEKVKLEEVERLHNQNKEAEAEAGRARRGVLVPCNSTVGSSSKESQEKQSHGSRLLRMKINFERRNAESLQSEFDRLWLFNERMNGRKLEGMTSIDLAYLHSNISCALVALMGQTSGPRKEQMAMQRNQSLGWLSARDVHRLPCSLDFFSSQESSEDSTTERRAAMPVLSLNIYYVLFDQTYTISD